MIKLLLLLKRKLISVFNPPYQLILDRKSEDTKDKSLYLFKQYGSHDFIKISYQDICANMNIMRSINPDDLRRIHIREYQCAQESSEFRITQTLRNNAYVLTSNNRSERFSGNFIGKNLDMFSSIDKSDLWKIARAEGFEICKKIYGDIANNKVIVVTSETKSAEKEKSHDNVVNFRDFTN